MQVATPSRGTTDLRTVVRRLSACWPRPGLPSALYPRESTALAPPVPPNHQQFRAFRDHSIRAAPASGRRACSRAPSAANDLLGKGSQPAAGYASVRERTADGSLELASPDVGAASRARSDRADPDLPSCSPGCATCPSSRGPLYPKEATFTLVVSRTGLLRLAAVAPPAAVAMMPGGDCEGPRPSSSSGRPRSESGSIAEPVPTGISGTSSSR